MNSTGDGRPVSPAVCLRPCWPDRSAPLPSGPSIRHLTKGQSPFNERAATGQARPARPRHRALTPRASSRRTNRSSRAKTAAATRKSETAPRRGTDVCGLKSPGTRPTPRLTPFAAGLEGLPRLPGHLPPRAAPKALLSSEDLAGGDGLPDPNCPDQLEPAPLQGQVEAPRRPFRPWEAAGRLPDQRL